MGQHHKRRKPDRRPEFKNGQRVAKLLDDISKENAVKEPCKEKPVRHGVSPASEPSIQTTVKVKPVPDTTKPTPQQTAKYAAAFIISRGPIWIQLVEAIQHPFLREVRHNEIVEFIEPKTVTFGVKRQLYRRSALKRRTNAGPEFNLTITVESIGHHSNNEDFLIIKGKAHNVMGLSCEEAVEIFYRIDARCGAIISHADLSQTGHPIMKNFYVPPSTGY